MEYTAYVRVMLKTTVLDPQGVAVGQSLRTLGYTGVKGVRMGKYLELRLEAEGRDAARALVEEMCSRLLANPVVEEYDFILTPAEGREEPDGMRCGDIS